MTYPAKDTSLPEASTHVRLKVSMTGRAARKRAGGGRGQTLIRCAGASRRRLCRSPHLCQMVINGWSLEQQSMRLRSVPRAG